MSAIQENIEFDCCRRMKYNPIFHEKHGKTLTDEELEYLCKFWEFDELSTMSMALGKTESTLAAKVHQLRKSGRFEYYKNRGKYY
ncbi:DNA-entry nuclease [Marinisporobacter balticus]|uniref:DNA-entry nuclease n=1 Tax=Marinisporobacter balticus TaxID=2018667 RepID=A0A4R2K852_9FIRM|nr:DNA-entry nuclease [Marinisporobacter balticus]TCO69533.1 hypothetical protein EV214_13157 [Marinisporobacter balticus]